jgi:hypothetical protein
VNAYSGGLGGIDDPIRCELELEGVGDEDVSEPEANGFVWVDDLEESEPGWLFSRVH